MKSLLTTLLSAAAAFAQSAAPLSFEVASVKSSPPQAMGQMRVGMSADAGRVGFTAVTLRDLMARAYEVKAAQISGPSWFDSERYDVNAKIPEGMSREQVPAMLRTLLEERFQLQIHRETKEMPVYELLVGKNGPKMDKAKEELGRGRITMEGHGDGVMHASVSGANMSGFCDMLGRWVDRPVIDKTGLNGSFDFQLELSMQDLAGMKGGVVVIHGGPPASGAPAGGPAPEGGAGGSLFTSIQNLGLKLEPKRAPLDLVIVDKAEKVPIEN